MPYSIEIIPYYVTVTDQETGMALFPRNKVYTFETICSIIFFTEHDLKALPIISHSINTLMIFIYQTTNIALRKTFGCLDVYLYGCKVSRQ